MSDLLLDSSTVPQGPFQDGNPFQSIQHEMKLILEKLALSGSEMNFATICFDFVTKIFITKRTHGPEYSTAVVLLA